jgi:hypothetical protein
MQIAIYDVGNHLQVGVEADQLAAMLPTAIQRSSPEKNLYIWSLASTCVSYPIRMH